MKTNQDWDRLIEIIDKYTSMVREELRHRCEKWSIDLSVSEIHEVVGGILARQVSLATQFINSPRVWNEHIAPLFLRTMSDAFITLAWILEEPLERSKNFVEYGLGQEKLLLEHLKCKIKSDGGDPEKDEFIKNVENWIDTQRFAFITEVNVGSWSDIPTRKMAEEANCLESYNLDYQGYSAAVHNMWNHICRYNLRPCSNPLHCYHRIPHDPELQVDSFYAYRVAQYADRSFGLFDEKTGIKPETGSSLDFLRSAFNELHAPEKKPGSDQDGPND